jgi:hypothetical protein
MKAILFRRRLVLAISLLGALCLSLVLFLTLSRTQTVAATPLEFLLSPELPFPEGRPVHPLFNTPEMDAEALVLQEILFTVREIERLTGAMPHAVLSAFAAELEEFMAAFPESPYAPALHVELGRWYRISGRYTLALEHWSAAWEICGDFQEGYGKLLADHALVHASSLLASLGRLEELEPLIETYRFRIMAEPHLAQIWRRTAEAVYHMKKKPGIAYKCGVYALNNVARHLQGRRVGGLSEIPSPESGFTLAELAAFSAEFKIGVGPAFREEGADFVIPSVVHWRQNHYAAVVAEQDGMFLIEDPTFLGSIWMDEETLAAEASGYFLIPEGLHLPGWRPVGSQEAGQIFGKGYPQAMDDGL